MVGYASRGENYEKEIQASCPLYMEPSVELRDLVIEDVSGPGAHSVTTDIFGGLLLINHG